MSKIKVIDAPCGAGKSYAMAKMLTTRYDGYNYIYITPYLADFRNFTQNIKNISKELNIAPSVFLEPNSNNENGKLGDLKKLIKIKQNIMTTHALFKICDDEVVELLKERKYILILDEALSVVEYLDDICEMDIKAMEAINLITIDKNTNRIIHNKNIEYPANGAHHKQLYKFKNDSTYIYTKKGLVWTFPIKFFECFKEVYICTYMFEYQIQKYYFDFYNVKYDMFTVKNREIVPYEMQYPNFNNLHICQDVRLNEIGDKEEDKKFNVTLSKNWHKRVSADKLKIVKNALNNFFRNIHKAKSEDCLWTTFKEFESKLGSKGFKNSFVPCNMRGSNDYDTKHYVAYPINMFMHPSVAKFFESHKIVVDEDTYALSEMIQFIWRSAIRKGEDVDVYIPSSRMRKLLEDFIFKSRPRKIRYDLAF